MILRRPHEFKIATLQDVRSLFPPDWNPFYAGFGNRDTDEISYKAVRSFCAHSAWRRLSLGHHACDDAVPKSFPSSYHLPLHPPPGRCPPWAYLHHQPQGGAAQGVCPRAVLGALLAAQHQRACRQHLPAAAGACKEGAYVGECRMVLWGRKLKAYPHPWGWDDYNLNVDKVALWMHSRTAGLY